MAVDNNNNVSVVVRPVVAAVINVLTGKIVETTTETAEKTALRLKVRDVLGRDTHHVVEFGTVGGAVAYAIKQLKCDVTIPTLELRVLNHKHELHRLSTILSNLKAGYEKHVAVRDVCLAAFTDAQEAERRIVEDVFDEELGHLSAVLCETETDIAQYKASLSGYEKTLAKALAN